MTEIPLLMGCFLFGCAKGISHHNRTFKNLGEISNNRLVIVEKENENKTEALKEVTIENIPDGSIAFTFDINNNPLSWLIYKQHSNANKKCDFILISPGEEEHVGKHVFLYGDLKSKNDDNKKYINQLKNTYLFTNYLIELINNYHREEIGKPLKEGFNIVSKFVVITNSPHTDKMFASSLMTNDSDYSGSDYMKTHEVLVKKAEQNQVGQVDIGAEFVENGIVNYRELLGEPSYWPGLSKV